LPYLQVFFFGQYPQNHKTETARPDVEISLSYTRPTVVKAELSKQGFIVVKEASIAMESEFEMPVIVPLTQGSWYQFVFIGDMTSKLYEVRMFDWDEKQVAYQKSKGVIWMAM
jgi:hypothetical protein